MNILLTYKTFSNISQIAILRPMSRFYESAYNVGVERLSNKTLLNLNKTTRVKNHTEKF